MKRAGVAIFLALLPALATSAYSCTPPQNEKDIWDSIKSSEDPRDFLQYLKQFPQGCFRAVANFRIKALVPEHHPLKIHGKFSAADNWVIVHERETLQFGDGRPLEWFKVESFEDKPEKLRVEYQCDAAGQGLTPWFEWEATCPLPKAPIQGFSVRATGYLADFYDLKVDCATHIRPSNQGDVEYTVRGSEWCGVRAGVPRTYLYKLSITLSRKPFDK